MSDADIIRLDAIAERLADSGLLLRGGINFAEGEALPAGSVHGRAKAVLLVGNAGDAFWPHFQAWQDKQLSEKADPLDTWSRQVLEAVAAACGARVVMPNDRPFAPFQQWAMRAEGLQPSPLGILVHPDYGLWHAYRGALLFDSALAPEDLNQPLQTPIHLCDLCIGKPCLNACPAGAFNGGFDSAACLSHISGFQGSACMDRGCLARNACPHDALRYGPDIQAFLMRAFRRALGER
jgi:hypothetical protein